MKNIKIFEILHEADATAKKDGDYIKSNIINDIVDIFKAEILESEIKKEN